MSKIRLEKSPINEKMYDAYIKNDKGFYVYAESFLMRRLKGWMTKHKTDDVFIEGHSFDMEKKLYKILWIDKETNEIIYGGQFLDEQMSLDCEEFIRRWFNTQITEVIVRKPPKRERARRLKRTEKEEDYVE